MGLRTMPCKRMLMHRTLNEGLGWLILMFIFELSNSKCLMGCLSICDIISDAKIIDHSTGTRNVICPTAVPCISMKSRAVEMAAKEVYIY